MNDLPVAVVEQLDALGVGTLYLFGSRARGDARPGSDADVALLLRASARRPGLRARVRLADALAAALDVPRVDVVVLDEMPMELRARVLDEGRPLHRGDEVGRLRFEVETRSVWLDLRPVVHEQAAAFMARVARQGLA